MRPTGQTLMSSTSMKEARLPLAGWLVAATLATAPGLMAAANPQLLNLVMPDAVAISGLQVQDAAASGFGQELVLKMSSMQGLDKLSQLTGFDPRTDLTEMVAASAGKQSGLLVVEGTFQPSQIENLAKLGNAQVTSYKGIDIVTLPAGEQESAESSTEESTETTEEPSHPQPAFAFLSASVVVAGTPTDVQAAIDRWIANTPSSSPLLDQVNEVSASNQAWVVSVGPNALEQAFGHQLPANAPQQLAMLQNLFTSVNGAAGGANFTDTDILLNGVAQIDSAEDAQAMADVLTFFKSLAQPQNPPPYFDEIVGSATFTAEGSTVVFSMTIPELAAEQVANQMFDKTTQQRTAQTTTRDPRAARAARAGR